MVVGNKLWKIVSTIHCWDAIEREVEVDVIGDAVVLDVRDTFGLLGELGKTTRLSRRDTLTIPFGRVGFFGSSNLLPIHAGRSASAPRTLALYSS